MTGNLVFLGLAAAGAKGFAVGTSAMAVGGFVVGVLIGAKACGAAGSHRGLALRNVLGVKLWLGGSVTVVAIFSGSNFGVGARDLMLILLAASMGAQLAAIRFLKVPDLLTVVLTMTITGALMGALLILNVGMVAALGFGLAIIIGCAIAAHIASRDATDWSAPRSA